MHRRVAWAGPEGATEADLRRRLGWTVGVGAELRALREQGHVAEQDGRWYARVTPDGARAPSDTTTGPAPVVQAGAAPAADGRLEDQDTAATGTPDAAETRVRLPPIAHGVDRYEAGPAGESPPRCEGSPPPLTASGGAPPTKPETLTTTVESVASAAGEQRQTDRLEDQDTRKSGKRGFEPRSVAIPLSSELPMSFADRLAALVERDPGISVTLAARSLGTSTTTVSSASRDPRIRREKRATEQGAPVALFPAEPSPRSPEPSPRESTLQPGPSGSDPAEWRAPAWLAAALHLDDGDVVTRENVEAALRNYAPPRDPDDTRQQATRYLASNRLLEQDLAELRALRDELDRLRESYAQEVARARPAPVPDDLRPVAELLVRRVAGDTLAGSPLPVRLAFAVGVLEGA